MTAGRGDCQKVGRGFTGGSVLKGGWQGGFSGSGLSPPYLRWTLPPASPELTLTTPLINHSNSDAVAPRLPPNCPMGQHPALSD